MQSIKMFLSIVFCLSVFIAPTFAQKKKQEPANKVNPNLGHKASIKHYESKEVLDMDDMSKLANAYRMNQDTENAEFWFSQIADKTTNPQDVIYFAQALQRNGRIEMTKYYFLKYDEMVGSAEDADQRARLLAEAFDRMNELQHTKATIKNESLINTSRLDFSPAYYKDGVLFASKFDTKKKDRIEGNSIALFYASRNDKGKLDNTKEFSFDIPAPYNEGPVSFSRNGKRIYFTKKDYINKKRRNRKSRTMKREIYTSVKEDDGWSEPKALPFNRGDYDDAYPTVSPDGKKLYFSSDREGGEGGMDLYVSEFKDGKWGEPKNMGKTINTRKNEVYPYLHDDGTMYFASNGWDGLGGLDIFSTTRITNGSWTKAKNIGAPLNSKTDDYGFVLNLLKTEGYLNSARSGGNGKGDIYSFVMPTHIQTPVAVNICAFDKGTGERISDVQFEIEEVIPDNSTASLNDDMLMTLEQIGVTSEHLMKLKKKAIEMRGEDVIKIYNTDRKGLFRTYMKKNRNYLITASKDGYVVTKEKFEGATLEGKITHVFCVALEK